MAWVAVDENKREFRFKVEPRRAYVEEFGNTWTWAEYSEEGKIDRLQKGSIEKLIGRKLTWEDEPVELKEVLHEP